MDGKPLHKRTSILILWLELPLSQPLDLCRVGYAAVTSDLKVVGSQAHLAAKLQPRASLHGKKWLKGQPEESGYRVLVMRRWKYASLDKEKALLTNFTDLTIHQEKLAFFKPKSEQTHLQTLNRSLP